MSAPAIDVESLLDGIQNPVHYVGGEWNSRNRDWDSAPVRICLAFPDVYQIGMSNLGIQILYELVNQRSDMLCDRAFCPWPDMATRLRERGVELFGLETRRALAAFDMVGFSLPYELGATGMLEMLDLGGIPLCAAARGEQDPIVIGGGASLVNPEPLADFLDLAVIGDGEELLPALLALQAESKAASPARWRSRFLERAAGLDGVYVPSFYDVKYLCGGALESVAPNNSAAPPQVERAYVDINEYIGPSRPVVAHGKTVFDRASIEIHRGCARGCRFCQAGFIDRPLRTRSPKKIREAARAVIETTGHRDLTLLSLNAVDYRDIQTLIGDLREELDDPGLEINIPSTRVEPFNIDIAQALRPGGAGRRRSITFAPEAASDRMREVIRKEIPDRELLDTVAVAFAQGFHTVKLYFMIGLPTEEHADVAGIARLARKTLEIGRQHVGGRARVRVGVSTFVPKAHTPFQWFAQAPVPEIKSKQAFLRSQLTDRSIKFNWNNPHNSVIEALLSLGDRRVGAAIENAWRQGARLDAWDEHFDPEIWRRACTEAGIDLDWYVLRERDVDELLPWEHIGVHTPKWVLRWERDRALAAARGEDARIPSAAYRSQ